MTEILITYETLYEILRNEKNRDEIQELKQTFYADAATYLAKNQKMLDDAFAKGSGEDDRDDIARQIKNIKSLIREIYERREKKIVQLALTRARTGIDDVGIEILLALEKELYSTLKNTLSKHREQVIAKVMISLTPTTVHIESKPHEINPQKETTSQSSDISGDEQEDTHQYDQSPAIEDNQPDSAQTHYTLKFLQGVPKFLGKELEVYGPFEIEDVATLPDDISQILIKQGKAALIE